MDSLRELGKAMRQAQRVCGSKQWDLHALSLARAAEAAFDKALMNEPPAVLAGDAACVEDGFPCTCGRPNGCGPCTASVADRKRARAEHADQPAWLRYVPPPDENWNAPPSEPPAALADLARIVYEARFSPGDFAKGYQTSWGNLPDEARAVRARCAAAVCAHLAAGEYDGLMERLHELDWGEWPAVGEAATAITTLQARLRELDAKDEQRVISNLRLLEVAREQREAAEARVVQLEKALRDRERLGELIYRAMYEHQGGVWRCVETREVWFSAADRLAAALSAPAAKGGDND